MIRFAALLFARLKYSIFEKVKLGNKEHRNSDLSGINDPFKDEFFLVYGM